MKEKKPVHIVLVEDNPADVMLLKESFAHAGLSCRLTHFDNGESALNFLDKKATPLPDLMVLDLNVPKRSGQEVLRTIRGDERLKDLPVVVVSSSDAPRDRDAVTALGIRRFITKPMELNEFLEIGNTVKRLLFGNVSGNIGWAHAGNHY